MFIPPPSLSEPPVRQTLLQRLRLRHPQPGRTRDHFVLPDWDLDAPRSLTFTRCAWYLRPAATQPHRRLYDGRHGRSLDLSAPVAVSSAVLLSALSGRGFLGLYSVSATGLSRWICLDLDDEHRVSQLIGVTKLLDEPRSALLESSRRGFHLWLLVEPAPWAIARAWGQQLARAVGLANIEVFPKGAGLNGVRAPLTHHPKDGKIYPLIEIETGEIALDPWALLSSRRVGRVPEFTVAQPSPPAYSIPGRTDHRELVAEIERYTRLHFYGPERAIGRCPFHDDNHPSLGVIGGYWQCFAGCGQGGLHSFRTLAHQTVNKI